MANIDTTTKPMAQKEGTELKAIFQASPTDPYANLLWESNRTPFKSIWCHPSYSASDIYHFNPATRQWTAEYLGGIAFPNDKLTRDFAYGCVGRYYWDNNNNQFFFDAASVSLGVHRWYTNIPEIFKTDFKPTAIWGFKDCSKTYYSDGDYQYVYDKTSGQFSTIVHVTSDNVMFKPDPSAMWAIGDRLFHTKYNITHEYKFDVLKDKWVWDPVNLSNPGTVWSDGDHFYKNIQEYMYELDPATLTWSSSFKTNKSVYVRDLFTDGHSCYTDFSYDEENNVYKYWEWDKYHRIWVQKTGTNLEITNMFDGPVFCDTDYPDYEPLVANWGNWGANQELYRSSMWAIDGRAHGQGTTFYARFWPNENNSYKEINNEQD